MEVKLFYLLLSILSFLAPFFVQASSQLDVVINEIAWMGTEASYNNEWIELCNNTNRDISLDGWILRTSDGTPEIVLAGTITTGDLFLLERTNDDSVPEIAANQIYTGALRNQGENIELLDGSGNLIDSVNCLSGWFAGDNKTKQTMERKSLSFPGSDPRSWRTSLDSGGTPKNKNSVGLTTKMQPEAGPQALPFQKEQEAGSDPKTTTYPQNIFINEVLPSPEGPDAEEEWIELFNKNDFGADISGWKIKDAAGKTKIYTFPENTKISGQGFFVLKRPDSKITLNNDIDGLELFRPDDSLADQVSYEKTSIGQSYNKTESGWVWSSDLTPGALNIIPAKESEQKSLNSINEKELATIGESIPNEIPFLPSLIAVGMALFSGLIILFLKRQLKPGGAGK